MKIEFFVPGIPKPGGSKRAFPIHTGQFKLNKKGKTEEIVHMAVTDDSIRGKDWRGNVINACKDAFGCDPLCGPLKLLITFFMPYRKGDFGTGKNRGILKANAPKFCETKPDGLKLRRSTEDALTGILWQDDSQVVDGHEIKLYGLKPGALIQVETIEENHGKDRRTLYQEGQEREGLSSREN